MLPIPAGCDFETLERACQKFCEYHNSGEKQKQQT